MTLPNGLMMQWGLATPLASSRDYTVPLAIPYADTDYIVLTRPQDNHMDTNRDVSYIANVISKSAGSFTTSSMRFVGASKAHDITEYAWLTLGS